MSDLLLYATTIENNRLRDARADSLYGTTSADGIDYSQNLSPSDTPGLGADDEPSFVTSWKAQIGPLSTEAAARPNQLKICDTSGYYRCGSNCSWTVPSGVTSIRVQQWAPGGGSGSNCCCGGAPFGPSGAFALYDMPVSPGQLLCFCAGCAYCCYAYQTTPGSSNSPTFVVNSNTGQCMKSFTPEACFCHWNCDAVASGFISSTNCAWQLPDATCGPTGCSGYNFCWDSGSDNVDIPYIFSSCNYNYNCQDNATYALTNLYSIPGIWPRAYIGSQLQGSGSFTKSPPVYGFESLTCCESWSQGSTCSGCCRCAGAGFQQGPGFGGYASSVHGGCQACGGDAGGMGMICVSWC